MLFPPEVSHLTDFILDKGMDNHHCMTFSFLEPLSEILLKGIAC